MPVIEPIIGTYERGDINEHIARLIRDLGNPEPPLHLEQVRELLKLDLTYYSKSDLNLLNNTNVLFNLYFFMPNCFASGTTNEHMS